MSVDNLIITSKNKSFFIDYEYFGYDNPIKLICDFMLHPKNRIEFAEFDYYAKRFLLIKSLKNKVNFRDITIFLPIFQIKWILIVLKIFNKSHSKKLKDLGIHNNQNYFITQRLNMANKMIMQLKEINNKYG